MDLRPVEAIAAINPVNVGPAPDEVTPPFAIDGTVPTDDDSYSASTDEQDRSLEEAEPEESDEQTTAISSFPDDPPKRVNLFA